MFGWLGLRPGFLFLHPVNSLTTWEQLLLPENPNHFFLPCDYQELLPSFFGLQNSSWEIDRECQTFSLDSGFVPLVVFQLYHADSFVSLWIFEVYLKYSGQEQSETSGAMKGAMFMSHVGYGGLTWQGTNRTQISPGTSLTCEISGAGAACVGFGASEPSGVAKQ